MNGINILENSMENTNLIIEKLLKQEQKVHPSEKIKVVSISSNVYSIEGSSGNISYYLDNEGGNLVSSYRSRRLAGYSQKLEALGYKEERVGTEYVMTKISDNSKVDKYSIEYYNIFVDLDFDFSLKYLDEAINSKKRLSRTQALELLPTFIAAGSLKINELEGFLTRGSITKEDFDTFLPKMKKLLKEQAIDERGNMKKFGKEVSLDEIQDYFQKGYINQLEARELYEIIKLRTKKTEDQDKIRKETESYLK